MPLSVDRYALLAALALLPLAPAAAAPVPAPRPAGTAVVAEGPWGRLELTPVRIRVPEDMLPSEPLPVPPWRFPGEDTGAIAATLGRAGVEPGLADALMRNASPGELAATPRQVLELPAAIRGRLYEALRRRPGNTYQLYPVRLARDRMDRRLAGLGADTRALLERLLYSRDSLPNTWLLADLPALSWLVSDPAERGRAIQAVSQRDSLLLRVRVDAATDVDALARWWGRGGRRRDIETLLRSVQQVEGGYDLDVVHLLPASVRALAYTYPSPAQAAERDCFWTAVGFFGRPASDAEAIRRELSKLRRVEGPPQLGDVLLLASGGELVHAAVYVAADVYFTKNGGHFSVPWLFVHEADLLELYDDLDPGGAAHYRWPDLD